MTAGPRESSDFFHEFRLERLMARYETAVEINLAESGVHPMTVAELAVGSDLLERLAACRLFYQPSPGAPDLRERIARLYPGAGPGNVLVTTGCAEANFLLFWTLLRSGDEVALESPNYRQLDGIARNLGARVRSFRLDERAGFALDRSSLADAVTPSTRLVAVTNPNNPTGAILAPEDRRAILDAAERSEAWLVTDEVYAGGERLRPDPTPTLYGSGPRVLALGSLSKAYGLPGLRIGWIVGPEDLVDAMAARHDYTVISAPAVTSLLAAHALLDPVRERARGRARERIRAGHDILDAWCRGEGGRVRLLASEAGAIACIRYERDEPSPELAERLVREESVLVAPGEHFGLDRHLRINTGAEPAALQEGLARLGRALRR